MQDPWDVSPVAWLAQPPAAREPSRFDLHPDPPWIRARTERQALFDVARVTAAAVIRGDARSEQHRGYLVRVADWWRQRCAAPWEADNVRTLNLRPGGGQAVALTGQESAWAARRMAALYAKGAEQMETAGARWAAAVLRGATEQMEGAEARATDPSITRAVRDTARDAGEAARRAGRAAERAAGGLGFGAGLAIVAILFLWARK